MRTLAVALAVVAALLPSAARGQAQLSIGGLVESHGGLETRRTDRGDGAATIDERFVYGSRYTPTVDGFVWHRRFLTYSGSGMFADQTIDDTRARTELLHTEPYRLQIALFPESAHSFTLRATQAHFRTDAFVDGADDATLTTSNLTQGFAWSYRGSAALPAAGLDVTRTRTTTETLAAGAATQTLQTATLFGHKAFDRWNPTLRYRLDLRDDQRDADPAATVSELGHTFEYSDRIRVGERTFITPTATYQINPVFDGLHSATTVAVPFAGPIDPTLDGTGNVRYSLGQGEIVTHTVAADGALTKRVNRELTLSGGLNAIATRGDDGQTWGAGGLTNVDALPFTALRTQATYALQVAGADAGLTVAHRGQLGATSTHVPRHTVTGNYYLNVIDAPGFEGRLVAQSWRAGVNSVALPRTVVDAGYGVELQEGRGRQLAHDAQVSATVTPPVPIVLRGAVDAFRRSSSGGGREATEDTGWGVQAGIEGSPLDWLTFALTGRRALQHVVHEDRAGEFVSERVSASVNASWRTLAVQTEAFLEREPVAGRDARGVRGSASYRFRIWTVTVDFEQSWFTSETTQADQHRVMVRLVRPLSHFFSWPWR